MLSMDTGYALQHVHVRAINLFCPVALLYSDTADDNVSNE